MSDLCSWDLLVNNPVLLGGSGHIVAIDEIMVVRARQGNSHDQRQWVFGAVDLMTGQFSMELITKRDAATLIPLIKRHVLAGSRIWSEERAVYDNLKDAGYEHETVNSAQHFVNPETGVHINNVQARWSACKTSIRRRYGVGRHHLPKFLDEYMWRARHPPPGTLGAILEVMKCRYPL